MAEILVGKHADTIYSRDMQKNDLFGPRGLKWEDYFLKLGYVIYY